MVKDTIENANFHIESVPTFWAACVILYCCCAGGSGLRGPVENGVTLCAGSHDNQCQWSLVLELWWDAHPPAQWTHGGKRTMREPRPTNFLNWTQHVSDIPCFDFLTHPTCMDDDIDALCPYCSILEHISNAQCLECGDAVDPSSVGHGALCMFSCCPESPDHVQCLSSCCRQGRFSVLSSLPRRTSWSCWGVPANVPHQRCNGQCLRKSLAFCAWIRWVRTVLQFHVATKRSMLVASLCLSMLVWRDAHCNNCASLLSLSMDTQQTFWPTHQPRNQFLGPPICRCCVSPVWVLHHSSNQALTDAWSGLQCSNSRLWLGICNGSTSHVLVPFRQVTSWVAHKCFVECAVIHPTWWSILNRMWGGIGAQDVRHVLSPSSGSSSDVVLPWSSCQCGSIVRVGEHPITVPGQGSLALVVVGACTKCDTVLQWAAQSAPTGAATILDDTRSRNCGFFGRPFPFSFPPNRAIPAESVLLGGWWTSLRPPTRIVCSIGGPMRMVREWTRSRVLLQTTNNQQPTTNNQHPTTNNQKPHNNTTNHNTTTTITTTRKEEKTQTKTHTKSPTEKRAARRPAPRGLTAARAHTKWQLMLPDRCPESKASNLFLGAKCWAQDHLLGIRMISNPATEDQDGSTRPRAGPSNSSGISCSLPGWAPAPRPRSGPRAGRVQWWFWWRAPHAASRPFPRSCSASLSCVAGASLSTLPCAPAGGLPLNECGHHRAACAQAGVLSRRGWNLENVPAYVALAPHWCVLSTGMALQWDAQLRLMGLRWEWPVAGKSAGTLSCWGDELGRSWLFWLSKEEGGPRKRGLSCLFWPGPKNEVRTICCANECSKRGAFAGALSSPAPQPVLWHRPCWNSLGHAERKHLRSTMWSRISAVRVT